ncbi:ABC transporter ATP-binding protein [Prauserella cavernicola]|uniref:ABC transporter ATP-binding protein n=1 Tax=Prauserella cavernicola TaxID=2800127 RepID=A0A934QVV2_9PSEU|nr:ABC transporter ATP-binding protein [Prauserella cavernicola]MBK1787491.1 ABC transporter ATP-binding protein [Prauserella cavernicola]
MAGELIVQVEGLTKRFGQRSVLSSLDVRIGHGEFVALLGRSGSGKSTLLRVLAGLDTEVEGSVRVEGTVSVAFQQPRILPWRRVWRNVVLGLRDQGRDRSLAERALAEVRLDGHADAWPRTLSGGEAQRVSLARALVREPDLLLLDEPFGALDALTRLAMHRLVEQLWREHRPGVLLVTHDVDEALQLADRVLVLGQEGRIVSEYPLALARPRRIDDQLGVRAEILNDLGVTEYAST